jgi:hypothetical protein
VLNPFLKFFNRKLVKEIYRFLAIVHLLFFWTWVLFGRTDIAPESHSRIKRQHKSGDARKYHIEDNHYG